MCTCAHTHSLVHCEHTHMPQHTCGNGRKTEWSWFSFLGPGTRLWLPGLQGGRGTEGDRGRESLCCLTDPPLLLCVLFFTLFSSGPQLLLAFQQSLSPPSSSSIPVRVSVVGCRGTVLWPCSVSFLFCYLEPQQFLFLL